MRLLYTERFRRSYAGAPSSIQKYDEARDIWQARVNKGWRFYFVIRGDLYYLLDLIPHPK